MYAGERVIAFLIILLLLILALVARITDAADYYSPLHLFVVCQEANQIYVGYLADEKIEDVTAYSVATGEVGYIGAITSRFAPGYHAPIAGVELYDKETVVSWQVYDTERTYAELVVSLSTPAPTCHFQETTFYYSTGPGSFYWEVQDEFGDWSRIAETWAKEVSGEYQISFTPGPIYPIEENRYRIRQHIFAGG